MFLWLTFQSVSILFPVFKKSFKLVVKGGRKKVGRVVGCLVGRLVPHGAHLTTTCNCLGCGRPRS